MQTDSLASIIRELETNAVRFKATGGYDRLVDVLSATSISADSVRRLLGRQTDYVGDILWAVCELENVEPFAEEALPHISNPDTATAAYAVEVALRGARQGALIQQVLTRLVSTDDDAVVEHAVRVLSGEGLARIAEIFLAVGWPWATAIAGNLLNEPLELDAIQQLLDDSRHDRQFLGVVLATLASESDGRAPALLKKSSQPWIRDHGEWVEKLHQ